MSELHFHQLSSGRKLAYAEYGDVGGREVFYFHGWPSSRLQGELLDGIGKRRGLRVIAPDRPGIGESDAQVGRSLLDWVEVVRELADGLGWQQFDVVGVSGGGPYVLATVHGLAERVRKSAVICGAPPLSEVGVEGMMWPYRLAMMIRDRVPRLLEKGLRMAERISHQPRDGVVMRGLMAGLGDLDRKALEDEFNYRVIVRSFQEAMRSGVDGLREDGDLYSQPWGFDVAGLRKVPLFYHGGVDKNIPLSLVEGYIGRIVGAKLVVFEGDGHYALPLLRAEEVVDCMLTE